MSQLRIYRAARIEALADRLAAHLRVPSADPLEVLRPVQVAVGNRGMERWLRNALAQRLKIASNIVFPFPRQAILELLSLPAADDARWQRDALVWTVLSVLPRLYAEPAMQPVTAWLQQQRSTADGSAAEPEGPVAGPETVVDRHEWTLAGEIASVLDKVAVYRPELLLRWTAGDAGEEDGSGWQALVWRAVRDEIEQVAGAGSHPSLALLAGGASAATNVGPLHIFAVSNLPALWLAALQRAAQSTEVHIYVLTPADGYWGDYQLRGRARRPARGAELEDATLVQHPLLTSLGKVARDHSVLLTEYGDDGEPATPEAFEFPSTGALGQLQRDLAAMTPLEQLLERRAEVPLAAGDSSLQLHSCHGPARQVEALREAIFTLLDQQEVLQFRDIVVMTPDVATYAPLVEAVFAEGYAQPRDVPVGPDAAQQRWGEWGGPRIRAHIADLGLRQRNPLADALLRMLALAAGRLTATALADLLASRAVAERFGLGDDHIALIRSWLDAAGARLGADAAERRALGLPAQHAYTLAFALERLALGVAMADDGRALFAGVAPYDEMEGEAKRVFGVFAEFAALVVRWRRALLPARPLSAWIDAAVSLQSELSAVSEQAAFLQAELIEGLQALQREADGAARPIALGAFAATLEARFERPRAGERASGSAVTVCALTPMRSVPFRVVCLLGMDDAAFPRQGLARRFDIVAASPQLGDPDPREDDRNLFLEAILSARQHLLVFYTGRDPQTDRALPPAVPVGDLMDALNATFSLPPLQDGTPDIREPAEALTWHHRVQPFSPLAFVAPDPTVPLNTPRRYDARMFDAARALAGRRLSEPPLFEPDARLPDPEPPLELALDELTAWLLNPIGQLVEQRAGVLWRDQDDELADRDALELDALENWQVTTAVLEALQRTDPPTLDVLHAGLLARALLPAGTPGRVLLESVHGDVQALLGAVPGGEVAQSVPLRVEVAGVVLHGGVRVAASGPLVVTASAPSRPKLLMQTWLRALALAASDGIAEAGAAAQIIGWDKRRPRVVTLAPAAEPLETLAALVEVWRQARAAPIPLFAVSSPAWAAAFASAAAKGADPDFAVQKARAKAELAWHGDEHRGDRDALPVAAVCQGESPWTSPLLWGDAAAALARSVWLPLQLSMQSSQPDADDEEA